ncbi:hypothetical protein QOT17_000109 [Balamuthia mandrillaris]
MQAALMNENSAAITTITLQIFSLTEDMISLLQLAQAKTLSASQAQQLQRGITVFCSLNEEKGRLERLDPGRELKREAAPAATPTCWSEKTLQVVLPSDDHDGLSDEQAECGSGEENNKATKRKKRRRRSTKWHLCIPLEDGFQVVPSIPCSTASSFSSSPCAAFCSPQRVGTPPEREQEKRMDNQLYPLRKISRDQEEEARAPASSSAADHPKRMSVEFLLN